MSGSRYVRIAHDPIEGVACRDMTGRLLWEYRLKARSLRELLNRTTLPPLGGRTAGGSPPFPRRGSSFRLRLRKARPDRTVFSELQAALALFEGRRYDGGSE